MQLSGDPSKNAMAAIAAAIAALSHLADSKKKAEIAHIMYIWTTFTATLVQHALVLLCSSAAAGRSVLAQA